MLTKVVLKGLADTSNTQLVLQSVVNEAPLSEIAGACELLLQDDLLCLGQLMTDL